MDQFTERTIGLAGLFQSARIVQQLAREGVADKIATRASLNSVLVLDAVNALAVFADRDGIRLGLQELHNNFSGNKDPLTIELLQYIVNITQLQKNLFSQPETLSQFSSRVEQLSAYSGDELTERMAVIYSEFLSPIQPKIIVNGEEGYLQESDIAEKVRASLLAGVRSSILWHQKGGSRWDFMLKRGQYIKTVNNLLSA